MDARTALRWARLGLACSLALMWSGTPAARAALPNTSAVFSTTLAPANGSFESGFSNDNGNTFLSARWQTPTA